MNELTVPWEDNDKIAVGNELEKLLVYQGIKFPKRDTMMDYIAALIRGMMESGIPCKAAVAGIRNLFTEDLKTVKLKYLIDECNKFFERDTSRHECEDCDGRGIILMRDEEKREFALRCRCPNGRRNSVAHLTEWNGEQFQVSKGRTLELRFANIGLKRERQFTNVE